MFGYGPSTGDNYTPSVHVSSFTYLSTSTFGSLLQKFSLGTEVQLCLPCYNTHSSSQPASHPTGILPEVFLTCYATPVRLVHLSSAWAKIPRLGFKQACNVVCTARHVFMVSKHKIQFQSTMNLETWRESKHIANRMSKYRAFWPEAVTPEFRHIHLATTEKAASQQHS